MSGLAIGGFRTGIYLSSSGNSVEGNFIGVDAAGTAVAGNYYGVTAAGGNNIGGTSPASRNVISGNGGYGLHAWGNTRIESNLIGTDASGTAALGNYDGISPTNGYSPKVIGGAVAGAGNVISGNNRYGVVLGSTIDGSPVTLLGNLIGTDVSGTQPLGNGSAGVRNYGRSVVGGTAPGAGNVIAYNGGTGVSAGFYSPPVSITSNSIFSNIGLGIDLDPAGDAQRYRGQ